MVSLVNIEEHMDILGFDNVEIVCLEVDTFIENSLSIFNDRIARNLHPEEDTNLLVKHFKVNNVDDKQIFEATINVIDGANVVKTYDFHSIEVDKPLLTLEVIKRSIQLRHSDIEVANHSLDVLVNINNADEETIREMENCLNHKNIVIDKADLYSDKAPFFRGIIEYTRDLLLKGLNYKWKNLIS